MSKNNKPFEVQRNNLVNQHITPYVSNQAVIQAVRNVPRHEFIPEDQKHYAYIDTALPIGNGQTISQPSLVAKMTELLDPKKEHHVLEVGTGSGYQAAILAEIVNHVYTIERIPYLAHMAKQTLTRLGYKNVEITVGDGTEGWQEHAPYDGIIVTAGSPDIPPPLIEQLQENGKIVIPVGEMLWNQIITVGIKHNGKLETQELLPVRFVPLIGNHGWKE